MDVSQQFSLPWPPSVNHYWRNISKGPLAGRVLISEEGRTYRKTCHDVILMQRVLPVIGRVEVNLIARIPDKRKRDLDNLLKSALDAITHAGIIEDDSVIDKLTIERGEFVRGGELVVSIKEQTT
jgi:crossover junction endodeoxyribonuclease RusA